MRRPLIALLMVQLSLTAACGYQFAISSSAIRVAPVTSRSARAELAACLTSELRTTSRTRMSVGANQADDRAFVLEAELLEATVQPSTIVRDDIDVSTIEQNVELVLRARLVSGSGSREVVWGPISYRESDLALGGSTALGSFSSSREGLNQLCRATARRVIEDATIFLATNSRQNQ